MSTDAEEAQRWRRIAFDLFRLLDDVDTASDIAKGDEMLFRRLVQHIHEKRHDVLCDEDIENLYTSFYTVEDDILAPMLDDGEE